MTKKSGLILLLGSAVLLGGREIDREEISRDPAGAVEFLNYGGPYDKVNTVSEIRSIGKELGRAVRGGKSEASYHFRYRVLHVVAPQEEEKFDADIFIIEDGARIDHIANIRLVISGYLRSAYAYSAEEADALAIFATVYNAIHRSDLEYFQARYKGAVVEKVSQKKVGISTRYMDWPGETQMLIPLSKEAGRETLADVESDEITESDVIEEMKKKEDGGLPARRAITELKEKEIDEKRAKLAEKKKDLKGKETAIAQKEAKLTQKRGDLRKKQEEAQKGGGDEDAATLAQKEEALQQEEETIEQEKEILATEEDEQQQEESALAKREERIAKEREDIAEESRERLAVSAVRQSKQKSSVRFLLTRKISKKGFWGQLVRVSYEGGHVIKKSEVNTIRGRNYLTTGKGLVVIAGEKGEKRKVRLLLLEEENFEVLREGKNDVAGEGMLLLQTPFLYTPVKEGERWYLGKFDGELTLVERSREEVVPYTTIALEGGILYAQGNARDVLPISFGK